jgi:hypothetical protein
MWRAESRCSWYGFVEGVLRYVMAASVFFDMLWRERQSSSGAYAERCTYAAVARCKNFIQSANVHRIDKLLQF